MNLADYVPGMGVVPGTTFDLRFMNKKEQAKRPKFPAFSQAEAQKMIAYLQALYPQVMA